MAPSWFLFTQLFCCKQVSQHSNQSHGRWRGADAEGANIWDRRQQSKRETNLIYGLALKLKFPKRPISTGLLFFFTWTHICTSVPIVGTHAYIFFMLPLALHSDGQYWMELGTRCCVSADHACGSALKCWHLTGAYQCTDCRSAYCQHIPLLPHLFHDEIHHVPSIHEAYPYFANFIRNIQ